MNNAFNAPAKLPMWRTVLQTQQAMIKNLPELFRLSRMWILLTIPGYTAVGWFLEQPIITQTMQALKAHEPSPVGSIRIQLVPVLILLINLPALASMAVAWHRLLLRQEHVGSRYLRLDRTVIRYAAALLLIELITSAPHYIRLIFQLSGTEMATSTTVLPAFGLLGFVGLLISSRLSLVLPAQALGQCDVTFGAAWRAGRHNTLRLFTTYVLCVVPWLLISGAILGGLDAGLSLFMQHDYALIVAFVLLQAMLLVSWMSVIGAASIGYRDLIQDRTVRP
jgi:hypothetical protein